MIPIDVVPPAGGLLIDRAGDLGFGVVFPAKFAGQDAFALAAECKRVLSDAIAWCREQRCRLQIDRSIVGADCVTFLITVAPIGHAFGSEDKLLAAALEIERL